MAWQEDHYAANQAASERQKAQTAATNRKLADENAAQDARNVAARTARSTTATQVGTNIAARNQDAGIDTAARGQVAGYDAEAAAAASGYRDTESANDLARREAANNRAAASTEAMYGRLSGGGAGSGGNRIDDGGMVFGGGGGANGGVDFDEVGARNAAFARAKEQSAATAQASLTGLRNSLGRRGITGGGYAQMRGAEALAPAADRLQDFTREQLISDTNRAAEIGNRESAAGLTRRGQDMSQKQSLLGLLHSGGRLY